MDVKIGETRLFDFDAIDPATGLPAAINSIVTNVYIGSSNTPIAYQPPLVTRNILGAYALSVQFSAGNGFAVGNTCAIRAYVQMVAAGPYYNLSLGNAIVRKYSTDDIQDAINAWIAAAFSTSSGGTVNVGDPIQIVQGDDYTADTRYLDFNLINGPELSAPAVPIFLGVGEPKSPVDYWVTPQANGTATRIDATTQRLRFSVPKSLTILQPAPRTLGYSIEARTGANADHWTFWRGVCESVRKYTT